MSQENLQRFMQMFLKGTDIGGNAALQQQGADQKSANAITQLAADNNLAAGLRKANPGMNVKAGDVSLENPVALQTQEIANQKDLGNNYAKNTPTVESAHQLENVTNTDGKGGVFTNPNAKLKSAGNVSALFGTGGVAAGETATHGIASLLNKLGAGGAASWVQQHGMADGSTEEAKSIDRLSINAQHMLSSGRLTDQQNTQLQSALGNIASRDPDIRLKAVQDVGRMIKGQWDTEGAGYQPRTKQAVISRMGGDPSTFLGNIPDKTLAKQQRDTNLAQNSQNPSAQPPMAVAGQKQVVKKQYSPSRHQTRIQYSDGSVEIKNGQQ